MKTRKAVWGALILLSLSGSAYGADKGIRIEGRINCPVVAHHGGKVYLQIALMVPVADVPRRRPMNLSVVLDRSGSMADEGKYEYANHAVRVLIDQLQEDDIFSLVVYDDVISVLHSAQRVGDRNALKRLLDDVSPRGATNLGGGLVEGLKQAERNRNRECLNRVILLSDGLANRGMTDPHELRSIARRHRSRSISITTMGVGLEYNENLMVGLSESGGGNYYFIESPRTLASMFQKELEGFSSVVAQNVSVELSLADGVRVVDVIGFEHRRESGHVVIQVGDLMSGERRDLTVELEVPPGSGRLKLAKGTLRHDGSSGWFESWPSFTTWIRYTKDFAEIDKNRDGEAQSKADVAISTRRVEKALQALDQGQHSEALREIREAKAAVSASLISNVAGAGVAVLEEQRVRLERFETQLNDSSDSRRAKKSIQFENYKVQKMR